MQFPEDQTAGWREVNFSSNNFLYCNKLFTMHELVGALKKVNTSLYADSIYYKMIRAVSVDAK